MTFFCSSFGACLTGLLAPLLIMLVPKRECHGYLVDLHHRHYTSQRGPIRVRVQDLVVSVARSGREGQKHRGMPNSLPEQCVCEPMRQQEELAGGGSALTATLRRGSSRCFEDHSQPHQLDWFVTPPMTVYIEDTDAYGVMYYGNYLRAYDRALHSMVTTNATRTGTSFFTSPAKTTKLHDDDWSIVSVEEILFKSPPPLGGVYCIEGTRRRPTRGAFNKDDADNPPNNAGVLNRGVMSYSGSSWMEEGIDPRRGEFSEEEVWDMTMHSPDGTIVYNKATGVTIARPSRLQGSSSSLSSAEKRTAPGTGWLPKPEPILLSSTKSFRTPTTIDTFRTYRDEFEPHLETHLPLRNVLNLMERSRTNYIGGPAALHRLQAEDNVLYVVTSARNCSLVSYECSNDDSENDTSAPGTVQSNNELSALLSSSAAKGSLTRGGGTLRFVPGRAVDVKTEFRLRRRGMVVDCYHTLLFDNEDDDDDGGTKAATRSEMNSEGRNRRLRMAQGLVTVMALNATTRRPTQALPLWLSSTFWLD